ncbi:type III secretion system export control protein [Xanthomonas theicola]|uniref:4-hydroxyphenylacetate catabolism regulator HpaA n=1 Tax=Xanthomonas theicola TaxID=56464 RepID=A0A2S6ZJ79_9XANT|nr:type III secretion system export control protein [Xanthomonas theicola]PPT92333.1 hypothetical protein XthCFBP4691_04440 [Xanthomonas theicola]QNH23678.1 type III secretion system export control protein [Xanthomonas theicola]
MIKPNIGRAGFSTSPLDVDCVPTCCASAHGNASAAEEETAWPGAAAAAQFPPSWRRRRKRSTGRDGQFDDDEWPAPPQATPDPDQAIDAASRQAHAGAQQQPQHGQSEARHDHLGGGQPGDAAPAAPEPAHAAHAPAAAATPSGAASALLEEILQRYRNQPAEQAQPALARALSQLRDGVLDRALPASFSVAGWILLREHLLRASQATATPAPALQQLRAQLVDAVRPTPDMPQPAVQTLHLLLPLLLLHAERPRLPRHRQRAIAMLDTLCAGMGGVRT